MLNNFFTILYIDPGTGSLILQVILAGIIAFSLFFRRFWNKLFGWMRKKNDDDNTDV